MNFQELSQLRPDLAFIADWVPHGAHVLDAGCGDGVILDYLTSDKACSGYGIEIADDQVLASVKRGVNVIQQDIEQGLAIFGDNSFDSVLCLSALQMMENVEGVLRDIARVGREAIVSFPNFAHWQHRLSVMQGRMPVSKLLPDHWYETPNVRFATIPDFGDLANQVGLVVRDCIALHEGRVVRWWPNCRGSLVLFRLGKQ